MLLYERTIDPNLVAISAVRRDLVERLEKLALLMPLKNSILTVIAEIATNAVKHGRPQPTHLVIRLRLDSLTIVVEVEDDGGPFEAFDRKITDAAATDTSELTEGGRGLPLIRTLMDKVWYEAGNPNRLSASHSLTLLKPTILVVEDSPTLLATYSAILQNDYRILQADNLDRAIDMTALERVDGIVTDLHLGDDDGSTLATIAENQLDRPPIPMLLVTGDATEAVGEKAAAAGFDQILLKPISGSKLKNAVASMLVRSARSNARVFRYFGGAIDADSTGSGMEHPHPFLVRALQGRAAFGTGDMWLRLSIDGGQRFILSDVMGHGLAAQLAGLKLKSAIQGIHGAFPELDAGSFLGALSRSLINEPIAVGTLVTVLVVDLKQNGRIAVAGAGHPRPLVHSRSGYRFIDADGPLPGVFENQSFPVAAFTLAQGERLVLMTDGIDSHSLSTANLSPRWLLEALDRVRDLPFESAVCALESETLSALTASPVDDWTAVVIELAMPSADPA